MTHDKAEDALGKAKALVHFAMYKGDKIASTEQVAAFYEVPEANVRQLVKNHKDEFESDGLRTLRGKVLADARDTGSLASVPLKASQASAWTPRATLRLGMLLRDSVTARAVRTGLLNTVDTVAQQSEEIELLKAAIRLEELKGANIDRLNNLAALHGPANAMALLGQPDKVVEVEKAVIETIDEQHKVRFKGQTFPQVVEYLQKRHGIRLKNGGTVKKLLKSAEKDDLIAHIPRVVLQEYIPQEHLGEVYKLLSEGGRQMLLGE